MTAAAGEMDESAGCTPKVPGGICGGVVSEMGRRMTANRGRFEWIVPAIAADLCEK
jgi:hypothetical protein